MEQNYIALDLETTGLNPKKDKILEIGAVRVLGGVETARYHVLVNPRRSLAPEIVELTGITDEMVKHAPDIEEVIGEITEFCKDFPLLGHRILFDFSFLKKAAVNQGLFFEKQGVDTLTLCRRFMPKEEPKNLTAACRYFGMVRQCQHRALEDAQAAHFLYQKLAEMFQKNEDGGNLEVFKAKTMIYKVKKEQKATKKQKEDLRYLLKYHKIDLPVEIEDLSRNEISRFQDRIISQYGRIR